MAVDARDGQWPSAAVGARIAPRLSASERGASSPGLVRSEARCFCGVVLVLDHSIGGQVLSQHIGSFTCQVSRDEGQAVVSPRGELDMATVGAVEQELKQLRETGIARIVLDLGGLTFMDSSGLHLVVRWTSAASRDGFEFELEPGPPVVQRIFELAALKDTLPWRRHD
jgi:anti-sigma B factor antagonist